MGPKRLARASTPSRRRALKNSRTTAQSATRRPASLYVCTGKHPRLIATYADCLFLYPKSSKISSSVQYGSSLSSITAVPSSIDILWEEHSAEHPEESKSALTCGASEF